MKQESTNPFRFIKNAVKEKFVKLNYFYCNQGKSHNGEKLNMVCLNTQCSMKGLVCSICKQNLHKGHQEDIIPLKSLIIRLSKIKEKLPSHKQQATRMKQNLQDIQKIKEQVLTQLKDTVQLLAEEFRQLQEKIMNKYQQIKLRLLNQVKYKLKKIGMNMQIYNTISEVIQNESKDEQEYQNNIIKITDKINNKLLVNQKIKIQQNEIFINLNNIMDKYQKQAYQLTNFLKLLSSTNAKLFSTFSNQKSNNLSKNPKTTKKKKKINKIHQQDSVFGDLFSEAQDSQQQSIVQKQYPHIEYKFCPYSKSPTIQISNEGKIAYQTYNNATGRYIFVKEGKGLKKQKITFRIVELTKWIGLGVGSRGIINKANYTFRCLDNNHGAYLVSSNGFAWYHKYGSSMDKSYTFESGDIIDVYLSEKEITYKNRRNKDQQQWKDVCFCINILGNDDTVEILND